MSKKRKKMIVVLTALALVVALLLLIIDYRLQATTFTFKTILLPSNSSFRVVHLSDLHGAWFGDNQEKLVGMVEEQTPDLIVMTGDMVDRKDTSVEPVRALLEGIVHLAPVYAVSGNHEKDNPALAAQLAQLYERYGVTLLENEMAEMRYGPVTIYIGGLTSDAMDYSYYHAPKMPVPPKDSFSILLYHATHQYENVVASNYGYAYMFSGHTHGGIVRLPFAGGVVDNELNLFPKYDSGVFDQKLPVMISSRGLGDSSGVPIPRINNRPEVVCAIFEAL